MRILFFLLLISYQAVVAHDGHNDLKANPPLTGTSIYQLGSTWKNQKGDNIKLTDLKGKAQLVVLAYTRCDTACPLVIEDLKSLASAIDSKQSEKVAVSIFSLDSLRETPESLAAFSTKRKLPSHWALFTSDANAVSELAAVLGIRYKRLSNGDFIHSNVIYFLNKSGEIVAQKEGLKTPGAEFIKEIRNSL